LITAPARVSTAEGKPLRSSGAPAQPKPPPGGAGREAVRPATAGQGPGSSALACAHTRARDL